ncbi:MAG: DUF1501 domain-containing protein [Verrucomicrobia bacterium]|nr:DUF1501 domain-containing protein [Verrucomicrobiota bacterium]
MKNPIQAVSSFAREGVTPVEPILGWNPGFGGASPSHFRDNPSYQLTRRDFFERVGTGCLGAAFATLLGRDLSGGITSASPLNEYNLKPKLPILSASARSVIHLFMNGGPSQMDLFDPKPALDKFHGQSHFEKIAGEVENPQSAGALMRSPFKFERHGQSGIWVSDALPYLSQCVDEIAVIRSMYTTNLTHEPGLFKIHSGQEMPGHPSLGAWVTYGLGSESQNLPAYVVLDDPGGLPVNHTQSWQPGYLPPLYQGTRFRSTGSPILNLSRDFDEPDRVTQRERELLARMDRSHQEFRPGQSQLAARIASYELAARMQLSATDALDLSQESKETLEMYGVGGKKTDSYARRCLYARRLIERGVRFVQLFIEFQIWDNHTELAGGLKGACEKTDQPVAALLRDLKQRGLLDSTLVIWGGEFGRLPIAQLSGDKDEKKSGRDHNKNAMVTWMAGGGVKGGITHGSTDELGMAAVENRVSVPDFHATMLRLLGLDHEELFFMRNGLRDRLTGVNPARIVTEILA